MPLSPQLYILRHLSVVMAVDLMLSHSQIVVNILKKMILLLDGGHGNHWGCSN